MSRRHLRRVTRATTGIVALALLAGCAGTPFRVPAITDPAALDPGRGRPIVAEASGFQLMLFIPIATNSRHDRAWRALQAQAAGDAIADVRVTESWAYGLVGTVYTTRMEAVAYPRRTP
jgi:hypothetical protein